MLPKRIMIAFVVAVTLTGFGCSKSEEPAVTVKDIRDRLNRKAPNPQQPPAAQPAPGK